MRHFSFAVLSGLFALALGTSVAHGWGGIVPEPSTASLLALGLSGVASFGRRRRAANA